MRLLTSQLNYLSMLNCAVQGATMSDSNTARHTGRASKKGSLDDSAILLSEDQISRRTLLAGTAGLTLGSLGLAGAARADHMEVGSASHRMSGRSSLTCRMSQRVYSYTPLNEVIYFLEPMSIH